MLVFELHLKNIQRQPRIYFVPYFPCGSVRGSISARCYGRVNENTPAVCGEAKKKRVRMHCLGLPPVHAIGGTATVITTRIADSADRVKPKSKSGDSGGAAAPMKLIAADESHTESESDSRAGRPLRLTPALGEEVDSSYSSYSDSDYEHPAVGGVAAPEVSIPAVCDSTSDCSSERDYDTHRRQRAKKKEIG